MTHQLKSFKLETELGDYIKNHVHFFREGMIMYPDQSCAMPVAYKDVEEEILNFEVLPDDIWLISYLKSGTTWTQEMVWLIVNGLNYEGAKTAMDSRFPFLEFLGLTKEYINLFNLTEGKLFDDLRNKPPPRLIKSHLPVGLLPRKLWEVKPKIIYVMRDPKDVAVSFYNHYKLFPGYTGSKEKFFKRIWLTTVISWGSYWGNVAPFWKMRNQPNILINTFEEMKTDLAAVIRLTADFLGKNVPEDEMDKLLKHLDFSNMQNNEFANVELIARIHQNVHGVNSDIHFMNEGEIGSHKEKISPEGIQRFDDWIKEEKIKYGLNMDTDFPY